MVRHGHQEEFRDGIRTNFLCDSAPLRFNFPPQRLRGAGIYFIKTCPPKPNRRWAGLAGQDHLFSCYTHFCHNSSIFNSTRYCSNAEVWLWKRYVQNFGTQTCIIASLFLGSLFSILLPV